MTHMDSFIEWLTNEGKDEKTIVAYRTAVTQFVDWYTGTTGHQDVILVKPIDVKEYVSYLRHTLNRKQTTINKQLAALKTYFAYLAEHGHVSDNPMTRIKLKRIQATDTGDGNKWLTKEEQDRFISYVELERNEFKPHISRPFSGARYF
jgi:site-specific recombinase XerD